LALIASQQFFFAACRNNLGASAVKGAGMEALLAEKRRGGRPSRRDAAALKERILEEATEMFLARGFGATSIDALAAGLGISKRTFYHRFRGKPDLFEAVVERLIARWRKAADSTPPPRGTPEEQLRRVARQILDVALSSQALALYRLVIAEASRFPDLARIVHLHGTGEAITLIESLLEDSDHKPAARRFAAEHFLSLVITVPRHRALGLGEPMAKTERATWVRATVDLFLRGTDGRHSPGMRVSP
jgi:TetR/AcrR family transcriptional repressor of mexJK operon